MLKEPQYVYTQAGNYEVRLIGKIDDIFPDSAYKTIVVDLLVFSNFICEPDNICIGESITLSHEKGGSTINNLQWQFHCPYSGVWYDTDPESL